MRTGVIKFFNPQRAFGFIVPDDGGDDIYFPASALPRDRRYDPVEGDKIQFQTRAADKGPMAVRIVMDQQAPK